MGLGNGKAGQEKAFEFRAPTTGQGSLGIKDRTMVADVIVIGAGLAGMMAAYAAQAEGAQVLLIDKGSIGRGTNTALANGVFAAPTSDYDFEDYIEDTIQAGRKI